MASTQESTKGLDTSTQDKEVSWREKIKNGLKQGEVKWAIGSGVCFFFLRILLAGLSKMQNIDYAYYLIVLSMYVIYFYVFLACFISITKKIPFLLICFFSLSSLVFLFSNIHAVYAAVLALAAAPVTLLLCKILTKQNPGRKVLGNFLLLGSIVFVVWQVFMSCPDSSENALNINCSVDIFEGSETPNKAFDSSTPFVLENRVVLIVSLGVFIYTAFLCTMIRSRRRWILYCVAGAIVFFTGASYYQDSDPVIQIFVFLLFLIVLFSFLPFITDDIEKEYPEVSEQLGRIRAYNRFHAWIRRSLKEGGGKAALLLGGWGAGKTHCLKYLSRRLSLKQPESEGPLRTPRGEAILGYDKRQYDDNFDNETAFMDSVKICKVDLWGYESREEAWNAIVQAMGRTILGRYSFLNSITLNKYLPHIMRSLPAGNIISNLYELFFWGDQNGNKDICERLSDAIGSNERLVLILDDIERASFSIIKALPPLIEKLRKIKRLMVICSLAKDELAMVHRKELGTEDSGDAALTNLSGYLIKVFDYFFSLPNLSTHKAKTFVRKKLKKYSDCELSRQYLEQCGLGFATPRQIERATEQLGEIERQFFYDADKEELSDEEIISYQVAHYNVLYAYYSHTAFLVEIIKNFYPQLLRVALNDPDGPVRYAQKVKCIVELIEKQEEKELNDEEKNELENFKKNDNSTYNNIKSDHFFVDLIRGLSQCKQGNVKRAIEGEYRRRIVLTTHECEQLYENLKNKDRFMLDYAFKEFFGGEESIPEDIDASGLEFFEYLMERVTDEGTDYAELLLKLIPQGCFQHDVKDGNVVFSWSRDHFFHLLYLYTKEEIKGKSLCKLLEHAVIQMFGRASIMVKYSILHTFFQYYKEEMPKLKAEVVDNLHNNPISVNETAVVMKELFTCYVKSYIQGVLKSEITEHRVQNVDYDINNFFKLLVERDDYTNISPDEFIMTDVGGIKNLIDILTLPCVNRRFFKGQKLMTASKRMVDLILPILQRWFEKNSLSFQIIDNLDNWIKKCDDSLGCWKRDRSGVNERSGYARGARRVRKFLRELDAKKKPRVGNEERKTSE